MALAERIGTGRGVRKKKKKKEIETEKLEYQEKKTSGKQWASLQDTASSWATWATASWFQLVREEEADEPTLRPTLLSGEQLAAMRSLGPVPRSSGCNTAAAFPLPAAA